MVTNAFLTEPILTLILAIGLGQLGLLFKLLQRVTALEVIVSYHRIEIQTLNRSKQ